jgi:hypothetical protein
MLFSPALTLQEQHNEPIAQGTDLAGVVLLKQLLQLLPQQIQRWKVTTIWYVQHDVKKLIPHIQMRKPERQSIGNG